MNKRKIILLLISSLIINQSATSIAYAEGAGDNDIVEENITLIEDNSMANEEINNGIIESDLTNDIEQDNDSLEETSIDNIEKDSSGVEDNLIVDEEKDSGNIEENPTTDAEKEGSITGNTTHNDSDLVPVYEWDLNDDLIMEVLDKTGVASVDKITYGDLKEVRSIQLIFSHFDLPDILKEFKNLVSLTVQASNASNISIIGEITSLKELNIMNNDLTELPELFSNLKNLEYLNLTYNDFTEIPEVLFELPNLKHLEMVDCGLESLPEDIDRLSSLESLELRTNNLSEIPYSISNMNSLRYLGLANNNFYNFPNEILKLTSLEDLNLSSNHLVELPNDISGINGDKIDFTLNVSNNQIYSLPKTTKQRVICDNNFVEAFMNGAPNVAKLTLKADTIKLNKSEVISNEKIKDLVKSYKNLSIQYNIKEDIDDRIQLDIIIDNKVVTPEQLSKYEEGVYTAKFKIHGSAADNIYAETFETVKIIIGDVEYDEDDDKIIIPDDATGIIPYEYWENNFPLMKYTTAELDGKPISEVTYEDLATIDVVHLSGQGLRDLPSIITKYVNLKNLYITGNEFSKIPKEVFSLSELETLSMDRNKLESIPSEITKLSNLKSLGLAFNNISSITDDFKDLKLLENLYLSGNKNIQGELDKVFDLTSLNVLHLGNCNLYTMSEKILQLTNLKYLEIGDNQLISIKNFANHIYYGNNLIETSDGYFKKLVLKDLNTTITKENLKDNDFINELFEISFKNNIGNPVTEPLNKGHVLEFIINGKVVSAEELSKYPNGTYEAQVKVKGADIENKAAITENTIKINIEGNTTKPNEDLSTNPPKDNNNNGSTKPNKLPNTGGSSSLSLLLVALTSIASGIKIKSKKK